MKSHLAMAAVIIAVGILGFVIGRQSIPPPRKDYEDGGFPDDEMLPEYDLRSMKNPVRGKFYKQYHEWLRLVRLDEEVGRYFKDEAAVNEALRDYIRRRPIADAS